MIKFVVMSSDIMSSFQLLLLILMFLALSEATDSTFTNTIKVLEGDEVVLTCLTEDGQEMDTTITKSVRWKFDNSTGQTIVESEFWNDGHWSCSLNPSLTPGDPFSCGKSNFRLILHSTTARYEGTYYCQALQEYGTPPLTHSTSLYVYVPPSSVAITLPVSPAIEGVDYPITCNIPRIHPAGGPLTSVYLLMGTPFTEIENVHSNVSVGKNRDGTSSLKQTFHVKLEKKHQGKRFRCKVLWNGDERGFTILTVQSDRTPPITVLDSLEALMSDSEDSITTAALNQSATIVAKFRSSNDLPRVTWVLPSGAEVDRPATPLQEFHGFSSTFEIDRVAREDFGSYTVTVTNSIRSIEIVLELTERENSPVSSAVVFYINIITMLVVAVAMPPF